MLGEDYKVVKHNFLINAKSKYKYTLNELKLICHLIANILPTDTNLETKKVSIRDLDDEIGTTYTPSGIKNAEGKEKSRNTRSANADKSSFYL